MELILIIIATILTTLVFRNIYDIYRDDDKSNDYPLTIVFMTTLAFCFLIIGSLSGVAYPDSAWKVGGYIIIGNGIILTMRYIGKDQTTSLVNKYLDKK